MCAVWSVRVGAHPHPGAVKVEQFEPVFPAVGEHEEMAAQRIRLELMGDHVAQPVKAFTQIRRAAGQEDPCRRTQGDHNAGRSCNKAATSPAANPARNSRLRPPGHWSR